MLSRLRRWINRFFNKSRKINHEPINKLSLIVIIIVDLFILFNVFTGLEDISYWPLGPDAAFPCHREWQAYRNSTAEDKDYDILARSLTTDPIGFRQTYTQSAQGRLGDVSEICLQYEQINNAVNSVGNRAIAQNINDTQAEINSFRAQNNSIRQQYDSTLLEEIAGQPQSQSINSIQASQARAEIEQNEQAIAQRQQTLASFKTELTEAPESQPFLALLADDAQFSATDQGYRRASFWYPSIQLFFQGLFLLPLIALALAVHRFSQRRGYGYVALISWHLLAIFLIPLIWKIFEFFQVGFLLQWLANLIAVLFGGLRFLWSYVQILLIPVIGFGIIKFCQKFFFNTRLQAANRIQQMRCVNCAKIIRKHDIHCPHCSYAQYHDCANCHNLTYQHLPHCKHCGVSQPLDL